MIVAFYFSGIATATFALSGLFFVKFWKVSQDRFFLFLSIACGLLSFERFVGLVTYVNLPTDDYTVGLTRGYLYLLRLVAFLLIIVSIVEKNRASRKK